MRTIRQLSNFFAALIIVSACSGVPIKIPEKYSLDNQLENVSKISDFHLNSWESVDNQSVILETGINSYYLIILNMPDNRLPFSDTIKITNANGMIRPGYDNINGYTIYNIYKFKDYEQAKTIKAQLREGTIK